MASVARWQHWENGPEVELKDRYQSIIEAADKPVTAALATSAAVV
ncbi:MAG: hypothetical protein ACOYOB_18680 [Myxococcota bacterium]